MEEINIVVRYNAELGFEEPALQYARRVFAHFDEAVTSLTLVPDSNEELAVYLEGQLVHSKSNSGRIPTLGDLRAAIHERC